ncbi:MAG: spermidine synthase [Chloroflexota bacterium]
MTFHFEELDYRQTPLGELILRRRRVPALGDTDIFEVKLGEEFLMSSLFHAGEVALAELGLAEVNAQAIDVVVGGLGLGYTAWAVLKQADIRSMLVIEAVDAVIDWHQKGLVPLGKLLTDDPRCHFIQGDFFALARQSGFDPQQPNRQFDAILLDIDHAPQHLLNPSHAAFYTETGLRHLTTYLKPNGVFALWSNDPPDDDFLTRLTNVFVTTESHVITFKNPLTDQTVSNTVYVSQI